MLAHAWINSIAHTAADDARHSEALRFADLLDRPDRWGGFLLHISPGGDIAIEIQNLVTGEIAPLAVN